MPPRLQTQNMYLGTVTPTPQIHKPLQCPRAGETLKTSKCKSAWVFPKRYPRLASLTSLLPMSRALQVPINITVIIRTGPVIRNRTLPFPSLPRRKRRRRITRVTLFPADVSCLAFGLALQSCVPETIAEFLGYEQCSASSTRREFGRRLLHRCNLFCTQCIPTVSFWKLQIIAVVSQTLHSLVPQHKSRIKSSLLQRRIRLFQTGSQHPGSAALFSACFFPGCSYQQYHVTLLFYFLFPQSHKFRHLLCSALQPDLYVFFPFFGISQCFTAEAISTEVMSYSALFISHGGKLCSKGRSRWYVVYVGKTNKSPTKNTINTPQVDQEKE